MSSLKEIKGRINSVKSTLKITSAMKLVASAKLHKTSGYIGPLKAYEQELARFLGELESTSGKYASPVSAEGRCAVLVFSGNASLCGGYNANVVKEAIATIARYNDPEVICIGKKGSEALVRKGIRVSDNLHDMLETPDYSHSCELAQRLVKGFETGKYSKIVLVYTHYVSTSVQKVCSETYLPFQPECTHGDFSPAERFIIEPGQAEIEAEVLSNYLKVKIYATLLDSLVSEYAARTVAMQTATDNGNNILSDLTLEYNKGRQAKITSEILDLAGGAQQQ